MQEMSRGNCDVWTWRSELRTPGLFATGEMIVESILSHMGLVLRLKKPLGILYQKRALPGTDEVCGIEMWYPCFVDYMEKKVIYIMHLVVLHSALGTAL